MNTRICVDPGHGGRDSGAVGPTRLKESDINLEVALRLGKLLALNSFAVTYTRTADTFPSLTDRWQQANREGVNYFISIHCNSNGPTAHGVETLHHPSSSVGRALAAAIQQQLVVRTGDRDRGLKPRNNLAVLNGSRCPAVLPEIGFISHPPTETRFRQSSFLDLLADAIGRGVASFLSLTWIGEISPVPVPPLAELDEPSEPEEPTEPASLVLPCPHCEKAISLSFGPTHELDAQRL